MIQVVEAIGGLAVSALSSLWGSKFGAESEAEKAKWEAQAEAAEANAEARAQIMKWQSITGVAEKAMMFGILGLLAWRLIK